MAKILFSQVASSSNQVIKTKLYILGSIRRLHLYGVPVKDVQVPVQWGHVAGKLWGNDQDRPILALHGWQDNAGTWDPLAPMLVKNYNRPILALDLPGHGKSSWIPPGMSYHLWELTRMILFLKEYFKWDKVSILAHSMGSLASFRFASLFSDDVDLYIAIELLINYNMELNLNVDNIPQALREIQLAQSYLDQEPPSYTWEEMMKIWYLGARKILAPDSVQYLLKRGTKQSIRDPNKYYFSRDPRLKHIFYNPESKTFIENLALKLKCPTLYIKAINSPFATDEFSVKMCEVIENNNDKFERHFLPGNHYLHLNNPEIVLPTALNFLNKLKEHIK